MYQVFEIRFGIKFPVSKPYPTWLGCKRVRNRIAREHSNTLSSRFVVDKV